jgi:hypothetical protein
MMMLSSMKLIYLGAWKQKNKAYYNQALKRTKQDTVKSKSKRKTISADAMFQHRKQGPNIQHKTKK